MIHSRKNWAKPVALSAFLLIGVAHPQNAYAFGFLDDATFIAKETMVQSFISKVIEQNISNLQKSFMNKITNLGTSIANNFTNLTSNLESQLTADSATQTTAQARMQDAADTRATERAVQTVKVQAALGSQSGSSVCNTITGSISAQNLTYLMQTWRKQAVQQQIALNHGYSGTSQKPMTSSAVIGLIHQNHCTYSATQYDVDTGYCPSVTQTQTDYSAPGGADGSSSPNTPDDTNADLLFSQSTLSTQQAHAMNGLSWMVTKAIPDSTPEEMAANCSTSTTCATERYKSDARQARASIAQSILNGIIASSRVIDVDDTNQKATMAWAEATAALLGGYHKAEGPFCTKYMSSSACYFPNGVSEQARDELQSKRWYFDPKFGVFAGSQSQAPEQKDMAMMQMWNTVQFHMIYSQLREMNTSLAAMEAMMAEKSLH